MKKSLKHPQIFFDMTVLFEMYYQIHEGMPKSFRVSVSEKVLSELSNAMRLIVLANCVDKKSKESRAEGAHYLSKVHASIEVAHAFVLLAWKLKYISNGAIVTLSDKFEALKQQALKWERWFIFN